MVALLTNHVFHSLIAFEANPFQNFVVRHEVELEHYSPWLGVGLCIGHRNFDFQVAEIAPMKTLCYPQRVGGRMSKKIEPRIVLQTRGFDHESVAIPAPDG